ncbi:MAG: plasmid mobilization protein [Acidithiobacillus ferrivorans]
MTAKLNKYARTKDPTQKRTHTLSARFNDDELTQITARRGRMTAGQWLRSASLGRPIPNPIPEANGQAWAGLAKLASNINQIAKALNSHDANVETAEVLQLIKDVRAKLIGVKQ